MMFNVQPLIPFNRTILDKKFSEKTVSLLEDGGDCSVTFILKTPKGKEFSLTIASMMSSTMSLTLKERKSGRCFTLLGKRDVLLNSVVEAVSSIYPASVLKQSKIFDPLSSMMAGCKLARYEAVKNPLIEAAYQLVRERFNDPKPVSKVEVDKMYRNLFSPYTIHESLRHIHHRSHPASIVYYLHEVYSHFDSDPQGAMVPIGAMDKGKSGAYFLCTSSGQKAWVFKPANEEPGSAGSSEPSACDGILPGEGAAREHIADVINELSGGFFNIPKTVLIDIDGKIGSAQSFVPNIGSVSKYMLGDSKKLNMILMLGGESVQRSTLFDVIFGNGDRHVGNLLVEEMLDRGVQAVMIDQGMILSADVTDPMKFDQAGFPQNEVLITDEIRTFVLNAPIKKWKHVFSKHGIDHKAVDMVDRNLTFFKACIQASDESLFRYGIGLEMKDIATMALIMHGDIVGASDNVLQEYAQFIINLKRGLHEWSLWKNGGQKTSIAAKFNRIRALMKFKPIEGLKMLGLKIDPMVTPEQLSLELYKYIIDPYLNR